MKSRKIKALTTNEPTHIRIADLPLGMEDTSYQINKDQFKQKFQCEYTENVYTTDEDLEKPEIQTFHFDYLNCLVICNYGGNLGYVLCAWKTIPANVDLFFYSGEVSSQANDDVIYGFKLDDKYFSAKNLGGYARFMPHLPDVSEIDFYNYKSKQSLLSRACFRNVVIEPIESNKYLIAKTMYEIPAFAPIGFHYGPNYWKDRVPDVINPLGDIVSPSEYYWRLGYIDIGGTSRGFLRSDAQSHLQRSTIKPLQFNNYPMISWFDLRDKLVKIKLIPEEYGIINTHQSEIAKLEGKWQLENKEPIRIRAFYQHFTLPLVGQQKLPVSVVCNVEKTSYSKLSNFFKPIKEQQCDAVVENSEVNEIVINAEYLPGFF